MRKLLLKQGPDIEFSGLHLFSHFAFNIGLLVPEVSLSPSFASLQFVLQAQLAQLENIDLFPQQSQIILFYFLPQPLRN